MPEAEIGVWHCTLAVKRRHAAPDSEDRDTASRQEVQEVFWEHVHNFLQLALAQEAIDGGEHLAGEGEGVDHAPADDLLPDSFQEFLAGEGDRDLRRAVALVKNAPDEEG